MRARLALLTIALIILSPEPASAYIGPGAGLSAIGAALALLAAIFLAIVGFVWYPVKRLVARRRQQPAYSEAANEKEGASR